ncbi:MAG: hypothetical protein FK734_13550 [Asgard group archaeon]|nr:hypothetical protein [Asgard group archaeon]
MSKNDEGKDEPPPIHDDDITDLDSFREPEDWDLPPIITEEDECPEFLEDVEPEEAIETIFSNIHISTIVSTVIGLGLAVTFLIIHRFFPSSVNSLVTMFLGFGAGVFIVFGASEIIILGVKGMSDKLNWNPYISGILQAIGAALAELVVIIILLVRSKTTNAPELAITAIVLILTTVIINIFFLGVAIIVVSKDEPFQLPKELTLFEANLILGMMVFSFVIMLYGFYFEFDGLRNIINNIIVESTFNKVFEIMIGIALVLVYIFFLVILIRRYGKKTSTPQTLISEFFPEDEELVLLDVASPMKQTRILPHSNKPITTKTVNKEIKTLPECEIPENKKVKKKWFSNGSKSKQERHDALATLRRFPWFIIILLFLFGAGGIVWGGEILASSIELGLNEFEQVPILVYSVVVGTVSSSPELVVTLRGLFSTDKEAQEVGLVHQVSAINQTFFILFGVPFVLSGIFNIGIPIAIEITIVMGGIFIISTAEIMMIMDDGKFDLLEGVVITILSIVSLVALALIGGISTQSEAETMALQLVAISQIL